MRLEILKTFNYGSVSGPQSLHAGNTVDRASLSAADLVIDYWIDMQWVRILEEL